VCVCVCVCLRALTRVLEPINIVALILSGVRVRVCISVYVSVCVCAGVCERMRVCL